MNITDAEEYTQALGQVVAGGWRQIALGERLGVPAILGLSTREWVEQRLGGYVKLSIPERQEAARELEAEGHSQRDIAGVLGVGLGTVNADLNPPVQDRTPEPAEPRSEPAEEPPSVQDRTPEPQPSEAVTEFLDSSEDLQRAHYLHEFMKVLTRSDDFMEFDPEKLGQLADLDLIESMDNYKIRVSNFVSRFRQSASGLRVVAGSNQ